ncbi:leucine-rich repeat-containing protein 24, partial [Biomphalaria glabrata]
TVHGNPWRCDCDLVFLIHLVKTSRGFRGGYDKLNSHHVTMTCETPSRGSVTEIDETKVKCPPSP